MYTSSWLAVALLGITTSVASAHAQEACQAVPIDMLGGTSAHVTGLNNWGQVVGTIYSSDGPASAYRWERGTTRKLPPLPGARDTSASAINDFGLIVGYATLGNDNVPVLWTRRGAQRLPGEGSAQAADINNLGQIVGNRGFSECILWPSPTSAPISLGSLGGDFCLAHAINDLGQVVGTAETSNQELHAFLWERGVLRDLGTTPIPDNGYASAELLDINNRGLAVGRVLQSGLQTDLLFWTEERGLRKIEFPIPGLPDVIMDGPASSVNEWGLIIAHNYDFTLGLPAHLLLVSEQGDVRDAGTLGGSVSYDDVFVNERFQLAWDADLKPYFCQLSWKPPR